MGKVIWAGVAALLCAAQAWAGDVAVSDAWTRATVPGQSGAVLRFFVTSRKDAQLLKVSSAAAGAVEMHSMTHDKGVMKMRPIESLALPAGKTVELGSEGNHVMLLDLKQPLKAGDSVPFSLVVQFADKRKATVKAAAIVKPLDESHHGH
ncbi:MAG: copper chaperone PCu(A)C [Nitrosomonadales bacterium]|nr:copper chaperone PCu(A)C [Nitrosomonadales bacterium]